MSRFLDFLKSDHVPRWQMIAVGVIAFLASAGLNEINYWRSYYDDVASSAQERVEAKLDAIERQSGEFQTFAGAFVSAVIENKGNIENRREDLIDNILAQDAAIDVSFTVFNQKTMESAKAYRVELRRMRDAVSEVRDMDSMDNFWQSAADLLIARNKLLKDMSEQAQSPQS